MRKPEFPLVDAIAWFIEDIRPDIQPTTVQSYKSCLKQFREWLPLDRQVLASVTLENAEAHVRGVANLNTRRNKIIALKSFAKYLARTKVWFEGDGDVRLSVLRDCKAPRPSPTGQPGYRPEDVKAIERNVDECKPPLRSRAIIAVLRHGFRAKEARLMLMKNVALPNNKGVKGHFIIDSEVGTKRGTGGVRVVPMSEAAKEDVLAYVRRERPEYRGGYGRQKKQPFEACEEPLFLTDDGYAIRAGGWSMIAQRLRRALAEHNISFRQHRLRPTRARELHEASWSDTDIMEALGWKSTAMLRRYIGRVSISHLKSLPEPMDAAYAV